VRAEEGKGEEWSDYVLLRAQTPEMMSECTRRFPLHPGRYLLARWAYVM
jgi:hypothetical protein